MIRENSFIPAIMLQLNRRLKTGLLPALLLASLLCFASSPACARSYLHTSGAKIVDSRGPSSGSPA